MENSEFQCDRCKKIYEKNWTDEAAMDYLLDNFKVKNNEKLLVVCEFCYEEYYNTLKN